MIASISGIVSAVKENCIVLENSGIGFMIYMPASSIANLLPGDSDVKIYTHMSVKEDDISLYGFLTEDELGIFKQLITVSGIGPKGALAVLSDIPVDRLKIAIVKGDAKLISSAQGIGLKTAQKICLELKNKYVNEVRLLEGAEDIEDIRPAQTDSPAFKDALDVLVTLGFSRSGSMLALNEVENADSLDSSALVSAALKKIK